MRWVSMVDPDRRRQAAAHAQIASPAKSKVRPSGTMGAAEAVWATAYQTHRLVYALPTCREEYLVRSAAEC